MIYTRINKKLIKLKFYLFIQMSEPQKEPQKTTEETSKNQKLDKIFWFKVIISFVFGVAFGVLKFKGFLSFLG